MEMELEFDPIESVVEELKKGKLVVVLDSKGRENEGDLIGAAVHVTPQTINFMVTQARGAFIAVFLDQAQADKLNLPYMVDPEKNKESNKTKFTLTCDTKYGSSGSSAIDRAQTVNILGGVHKNYSSIHDSGTVEKEESGPEDLVRPGHIQPIIATGLEKRQGHTDAGYELMKMAGFSPAVAVDLEIMDPTGNMAREEYLYAFAKMHNLKICKVEQVCEHLGIDKL